MRAVEISSFGDPDVLRLVERPLPVPGPGDVRVRVAAAGVNRPDVLQRRGRYAPPPGAPDLPGLEVAGIVDAVGPGVTRWHPGEAVCGLVAGGGYAEFCLVPAPQCLPVPAGLSLLEAGAIPETFFTVWTNVFGLGRLRAGESLLVHGGSSGIGTTAIQLGWAFGARVFATAGTPEKCAACERLGAELAVNYRTTDWAEALAERTGGRGVDVILDMVGGDYTPRNLKLLAMDGRLVQIAFLRAPEATVDLAQVMRHRLTLTGSFLRPQSVEEKGRIAEGLATNVWPLLERGIVRPVIDTVVPLDRAADAHRLLEAGTHVGKIVLQVM